MRRQPTRSEGRWSTAARISAPLVVAFMVCSALPIAARTVEPASGAPTAAPEISSKARAALSGSVHARIAPSANSPLHAAGVYAYRLADLSLRKAFTDVDGEFVFSNLPAGLYKVIAHKPGFVPAVVMLTRTAPSVYQQLELELAPEDFGEASNESDFWRIRERIPRDVLREITLANAAELARQDATDERLQGMQLETQMRALTGVGNYAGADDSQMRGGELDLLGNFGAVRLGVAGEFRELESSGPAVPAGDAGKIGQASALAVRLDAPNEARFVVAGHQGELRREDGPIDFERYQVSWEGEVGTGRSEVRAQYVNESNFYRDARFTELQLPAQSQTLELAGSYQATFGQRTSLQTGLRYRERRSAELGGGLITDDPAGAERLDLFGQGDVDLHRRLSIEYGLFTTLFDDSVAVTPQLGVVLGLGAGWQAHAEARRRFETVDAEPFVDFMPLHFGVLTECSMAESDCYRLRLVRKLGETGELSVSGLQRTYADTLRVYFSEDFFDQLESLFFVQGDKLPEVQIGFQRRFSPGVMARFRSNVAAGGGGMLRSGNHSYRNDVAYVVTALGTRFDATDTDVELAYRSVEQTMHPLDGDEFGMAVEMDRVRLLVTQGFRELLGLSSDWAVLLDLQVSRNHGGELYADLDPDELQRRILGGISVRF